MLNVTFENLRFAAPPGGALTAPAAPALTCPAVTDETDQEGLRAKSEQAIGDLAQALLENPMFNQALSAAFGAREVAQKGQRAAMGALNLGSNTDVERLERRLRSLSQRLESVEDQLDQVARDVSAIRRQLAGSVDVGADQASLRVED
jgi:septal ring factor EnvC (AmiA/AmiB activator)